jgi:hypothetical protein
MIELVTPISMSDLSTLLNYLMSYYVWIKAYSSNQNNREDPRFCIEMKTGDYPYPIGLWYSWVKLLDSITRLSYN